MNIIYHVTTKQEWDVALQNNFYEAPSLKMEGFIHCSKAEQVQGVLERYFKGKNDLVKLVIDTTKLTNKLQFDFSASVNEEFPHVYGVINIDAVIDIVEI
ncbi:hypothetical protein GALL_54850 [mine drainage metagenome]|uniref:DUF952 domain-containing protein n=1 Tax=mine drainage metagenome TaxID=410659 RepID=A0A1J5T9Y6_9ZZZZ